VPTLQIQAYEPTDPSANGTAKHRTPSSRIRIHRERTENESIGRLHRNHLDDLRRSGLSDETILTNGLYSLIANHPKHWCTKEICDLLGWKNENDAQEFGAVLVFPYRNAKGQLVEYCRMKPNCPRTTAASGPIKYEAPTQESNRCYFPVGVIPALSDASVPLVITEGEKKALKAVQEGFLTVGLAGVWSWTKRRGRNDDDEAVGEFQLIDDLAGLPWQGRVVYICFDSDIVDKEDVRKAQWNLARILRDKGAELKAVILPAGPNGQKVGLDDFLMANGPDAFRTLLNEAVEPVSPFALRPEDQPTDLGNAKRLVRHHGPDLRYCPEWDSWFVWDGTCWKKDVANVEVMSRAKMTAEKIMDEAVNRANRLQDEAKTLPDRERAQRQQAAFKQGQELTNFARVSQSRRRLQDMVELAASEPGMVVRPDQLDTDPMLLNVRNGTLDLRTGELLPHRREDLITKLSPVNYDPGAEAPIWTTFLNRIMGGNEELVAFLQRSTGYVLTGSVQEQCLFFCHGSGSNGKSTFLRVLLDLMGDYGMQTPPELLNVRRGEVHPTERADLAGRRLAAAVENSIGDRLDESLVKVLTGGDRIRARRMRQDHWEFAPTHKLWVAANHKPGVRGTDNGIWRRVKLIPFNVTISEAEADRSLPDKLTNELPGILAWSVRGCLEWQRGGLQVPPEVVNATTCYRDESDPLAEFYQDVCRIEPGTKVKATLLHQAYVKWAERKRLKDVLGRNSFNAAVEGRFQKRTNSYTRSWEFHGVEVTPEAANRLGVE
jgi:putative DNA primase/helicase